MKKSKSPATSIYTIRAAVAAFPEDDWRLIEIRSDQTVGELGAAVLASFESLAYHLWYIETPNALHFEYDPDDEMVPIIERDGFTVLSADDRTIGQLELAPGSTMEMDYDYGTTWVFLLTVEDITPSAGRTGDSPRVTAGRGPRMLDDVPPEELQILLEHQKQGGTIEDLPDIQDFIHDDDWDWHYCNFSLKTLQKSFPAEYNATLDAYRNPVPPPWQTAPDLKSFLESMQQSSNASGSKPKSASKPSGKAKTTGRTTASKAKIYTFRFEVAEWPEEWWREVEIGSDDTVGDLAAAVLASFESDADHMWDVQNRDSKFIHWDEDEDLDFLFPWGRKKRRVPRNAFSTTLGDLNLRVRSKFVMSYDYGTTWEFILRVVASRPAEKDKSTGLPRLIAGHGGPMIEDIPPWVVGAMMRCAQEGRDFREDETVGGYAEYFEDGWEYPALDLDALSEAFPHKASAFSSLYRFRH